MKQKSKRVYAIICESCGERYSLRTFSKENPEIPWTTKRVLGLITERTGVNYSQRQVTRILNRWNFGLTSGRPMYWHRASEEDIIKFGKKNKILQK